MSTFNLEVTKMLYLPIVEIKQGKGKYLPPRPHLQCIQPILDKLIDYNFLYYIQDKGFRYVYLSVHKDFVQEGNYQLREGWHVDGYKTDDLTFIYVDGEPTEALLYPPKCIRIAIENGTMSHGAALELFEHLGSYRKPHKLPTKEWVPLTNIIHRTPKATKSHVRTFIKINVSKHKYNLRGNAINEINKDWRACEREDLRNHPIYSNHDFKPEIGANDNDND